MNNFTELVFVLDKSGSMRSLETDTRNGFNKVIEQSRAVAEPNTVFASSKSIPVARYTNVHPLDDLSAINFLTSWQRNLLLLFSFPSVAINKTVLVGASPSGKDLEEAKTIGIDEKFATQFARNRRGVQSMCQKMVSLSKAAIVNYTVDTDKKCD